MTEASTNDTDKGMKHGRDASGIDIHSLEVAAKGWRSMIRTGGSDFV